MSASSRPSESLSDRTKKGQYKGWPLPGKAQWCTSGQRRFVGAGRIFGRSVYRLRAKRSRAAPAGFCGPWSRGAYPVLIRLERDLISWLNAAAAGSAPPTLSKRAPTAYDLFRAQIPNLDERSRLARPPPRRPRHRAATAGRQAWPPEREFLRGCQGCRLNLRSKVPGAMRPREAGPRATRRRSSLARVTALVAFLPGDRRVRPPVRPSHTTRPARCRRTP